MQTAPAKSIASAVLWHTCDASRAYREGGFGMIKPLLQSLTICGSPMQCIAHDSPLRYLGGIFTLTMDSKPHFDALKALIHEKSLAMASSHGTMRQKLEMERQCVVTAISYHLAIAPFSLAQLRKLDKARARALKTILRLPNSAPSDVLFTVTRRMGCQLTSLTPMYTQICAEAFTSTLNDKGRLGILSRALSQAHLTKLGHASIEHAPSS